MFSHMCLRTCFALSMASILYERREEKAEKEEKEEKEAGESNEIANM